MRWISFEYGMRVMIQQMISRPGSPIIEASGDEQLLLRLFRTLPQETQDEFLKEIGVKALLTVNPEIDEDDEEIDERLGNEIRRLMPYPPDYESFNQAVDTLDVTSIIFGSSRTDGENEADLAVSAEVYKDDIAGNDFSPEDVEGYLADWREKVVSEIERLCAAKQSNQPPQ